MSGAAEQASRAEGPPVVDSGRTGSDPTGAVVLVLDPAGAGRHGHIPASWNGLDPSVHVTWLRLPAVESPVATARAVLAELSAGEQHVHLLAAGEACELAELLAVERPQCLRSMLLVDPADRGTGLVDHGGTVVDQALLEHQTRPAGEVLAGHGVPLRVMTFDEAERADHGAPLPLGHPVVVEALTAMLSGRPEEAGTAAAAPASASTSTDASAPASTGTPAPASAVPASMGPTGAAAYGTAGTTPVATTGAAEGHAGGLSGLLGKVRHAIGGLLRRRSG